MNKGFSDSLAFDIAEITRKGTLIRYDEYITILIELKQWEKDEKVADEMLHSVRTYVGGADRFESHPSYHYTLSICLSLK